MLKIRLKRLGAKKAPTYRVIVINSTTKREGKPIEELGYYNPKTKDMKLNKESAVAWISKGAQATETVKYLIANCNDDGTLNYKKSETVKLSKKALAKKAAEEEAKKAAEEAKKAEEEAAAEAPAESTEEAAPEA
ncbi:30S ribosomal protein S16 [bacterium]|nr:30S ribosomal protein S16 [bacterium]